MKHVCIIVGLAILVLAFILIRVSCKTCEGTGLVSGQVNERVTCPNCHGRGKIELELAKPSGVKSTFTQTQPTCPRCAGRGYTEKKILKKDPCGRCKGKGSIPLYRWILEISSA